MRYFLDISYKGTEYHGWQVQKNAMSVQQKLNEALGIILSKEIETVGSGRTDTGVHAAQQIVHLDLDQAFTDQDLYKLNRILPHDIVVNKYCQVRDASHARFDAVSRAYQYRISIRKNPFLTEVAYIYGRPLNLEVMNSAAAMLLKHTDFESFSRVQTEVETFLCTITHAQWTIKEDMIFFDIEANRFLRGMVRALVGTMMDVGLGKITLAEFDSIIQSKDRKAAGRAVPAEGLFLTAVKYPDNVYLYS